MSMSVERVAADIVEAGIQSGSMDELGRFMLERLRTVARCDSALLLPDSRDEVPVALDRKPLFVGRYRDNQGRYGRELERARQIGVTHGAYIDTQIFSFDERQKLSFFNEIIRPQRVASRMIAHLHFRGRGTATIHLCAEGRSRFEPHSLDNLRRLVPSLSLAYAAAHAVPQREPLAGFTAHQELIANYVAGGYSNKEIAAFLRISPNTVRNQLVAIFRKTGAVKRAQLAMFVARRGGGAD